MMIDTEFVCSRFSELLGPFGFAVHVEDQPWEHVVRIDFCKKLRLCGSEQIWGNQYFLHEKELMTLRIDPINVSENGIDFRNWLESFIRRTAKDVLMNVFNAVAEPLPQAPTLDWRPNHVIPDDTYAA